MADVDARNVIGDEEVYDSLLLSASELLALRQSLVMAIKRIDKTLAGKSTKGKTLADYILNGVCAYYNIRPVDLRQVVRKPTLVARRRIAICLLKRYTDRTLQEIADMVGYKKHDLVLYHYKEAEQLLSDEFYGDKGFKKTYQKILKQLDL